MPTTEWPDFPLFSVICYAARHGAPSPPGRHHDPRLIDELRTRTHPHRHAPARGTEGPPRHALRRHPHLSPAPRRHRPTTRPLAPRGIDRRTATLLRPPHRTRRRPRTRPARRAPRGTSPGPLGHRNSPAPRAGPHPAGRRHRLPLLEREQQDRSRELAAAWRRISDLESQVRHDFEPPKQRN